MPAWWAAGGMARQRKRQGTSTASQAAREGSRAGRAWPVARRLQAMCIHTPTYGTVSSTLLALTPGAAARYLYAAGHPCEAPLVDARAALD